MSFLLRSRAGRAFTALLVGAAPCACDGASPQELEPVERTAARPGGQGEEPGPAPVDGEPAPVRLRPEELAEPHEEPIDVTATSRIAGPIGDDDGVILGCTGPGHGVAVLCVDVSAAPSGNGTAATPYRTIMAAVAAAKAGDVIQIAEGHYLENVTLGGIADNGGGGKAVSLRGGFESGDFTRRDASVYRTRIDGSAAAQPVIRVYLGAGSMVIDGLIITGGRGRNAGYGNGYGGGLDIENNGAGTIKVSHCEITGNRTPQLSGSQYGGGVLAENSGSGEVVLEHNRVHGNVSGKGAGLTLLGNRAWLHRNLIEDNVGHSDHGGGVYVATTRSTVSRNVIRGNVTGSGITWGWGGGLIFDGGTGFTEHNVITDNYAPSIGSGVFWDEGARGTMRNDFVYRNRCAGTGGAAIYVDGIGDSGGAGTHVTIQNATIADHDCGDDAGAIYVERRSSILLRDSILWNNSLDGTRSSNSSITASHSRTTIPGTGNTTADPLFVDPAVHDYHVRSLAGRWDGTGWISDAVTSPAIDAGDPATPVGGEPIPHGGRVEMGAHGGTAEASKSLGAEACDAPAYPLAQGRTMQLVGTTTGTADDLHSCWDPDPASDGGDAVYLLELEQPGGTLTVTLDEPGPLEAHLVIHDGACGDDASQYCFWSFSTAEVAMIEPTTTTVFVVVDTEGGAPAGKYTITARHEAAGCGDGYVNTGELCDHGDPVGGCTASCTFAPPVAGADTCSAATPTFSIPAAGTVLTSSETLQLTTDGYGDDSIGSCAWDTGGSDQVLRLVPQASGTMRVRIGHDADGPVWEHGLFGPHVWDEALHVRSSCDPGSELACVDDSFAGEELEVQVVAGEDYFLFVDGYDGGSYSRGPYELRVDMLP